MFCCSVSVCRLCTNRMDRTSAACATGWPLQDIVLLLVVCGRINRPFILPARLHCPHCCNTIARLLGNIRPPPRPPLCMSYTIQNWQLQYRVKAKSRAVLLARRACSQLDEEFESHGGRSEREWFAAGSVGGRHPVVSPVRTPVLLLARRACSQLHLYQR